MLVSFTQTYGDSRKKLHKVYSRDKQLIEFKSHFDINYHSFHNCSKETIEHYKSINTVKNTEYLVFNNITYGECIGELKKKLREVKCTHFFFSQDDTFGSNNDKIDYTKLLEYITSHKENFLLNFSYNPSMINTGLIPENINGFDIYKANTLIFAEKCGWPLNDDPYICTMDILEKVYDDNYIEIDNVWDCEVYNKNKFGKEKIPRYYLGSNLFFNHNLIGRYAANLMYMEGRLKARGIW